MYQLRRLIAAITALTLLLGTVPVAAQQTGGGSGLSISPTLFQYTINPGESKSLTITLRNVTGSDVTAQVYVNDFQSDNQTGNPKILTNSSPQSPNSIKNFLFGLGDVPLVRDEQQQETVAIKVPSDTPPGAYYGIIRYRAVPAGLNTSQNNEVALTASVGAVVLITVPGNLREQIQLTGIHIYSGQNGSHEGSVFIDKPTMTGIAIRNLGNGFSQPFGTIEIENMFKHEVFSYQMNKNDPKANILPTSSRVFKDPIKNISRPGRYTVIASVAYGSNGQVISLTKTFWYVPLWFLGAVLAVLLVVGLFAFRAYRHYRKDVKRAYRRKE
jgi:hypothetical protein